MPQAHSSICITKPDPGERVAKALLSVYSHLGFCPSSRLVAVCIGSDRATGDSLGPLVGSMLTWNGFTGKVLGTLEQPVHAGNLDEALLLVEGRGVTVLGVDACLGTKKEVGTIIVSRGSLKPGLGVKKQLPPVGDLHIAGVVNVGGFMEHLVLQNTRLNLVIKMAQAIAWGIIHAAKHMDSVHPETIPGPQALEQDATPSGLTSAALHPQLLPVSGLRR